jgi:hypothetical protein
MVLRRAVRIGNRHRGGSVAMATQNTRKAIEGIARAKFNHTLQCGWQGCGQNKPAPVVQGGAT